MEHSKYVWCTDVAVQGCEDASGFAPLRLDFESDSSLRCSSQIDERPGTRHGPEMDVNGSSLRDMGHGYEEYRHQNEGQTEHHRS